jgi:L-alanine-DL-glutamate epimerase-like enolase superfamily enzyme
MPSLNEAGANQESGDLTITAVRVWLYDRLLDGACWNPAFRWTRRQACLMELVTAGGLVGLGECWSGYRDVEDLCAFVRRAIVPLVVGRDAAEVDVLADACRATPSPEFAWMPHAAASGIDIACWDLRAQHAGLPLHRLLGAVRDAVPVYASGGLYRDGADEAALGREMAGYVADGFTAVKLKIGALEQDADLRRVAAVREAVGDGVVIWVDGVGTYDVDGALAMAERLASLKIAAFQAPVAYDRVDDLAAVTRRAPIATIGVETEPTLDGFRHLLVQRAVSILQPCVTLCGGISGALHVIDLAAASGTPITLQCFSTAVAEAASFHVAASRAAVASVEYHMFHDNLYERFPPAWRTITRGTVAMPDVPGLGVALAADARLHRV